MNFKRLNDFINILENKLYSQVYIISDSSLLPRKKQMVNQIKMNIENLKLLMM